MKLILKGIGSIFLAVTLGAVFGWLMATGIALLSHVEGAPR